MTTPPGFSAAFPSSYQQITNKYLRSYSHATSLGRKDSRAEQRSHSDVRYHLWPAPRLSSCPCQRRAVHGDVHSVGGSSVAHQGPACDKAVDASNGKILQLHRRSVDS